MDEIKHCLNCDLEKPSDPQHWYFNRAGRPISPCKDCRCKRQRERYRNDPVFKEGVCDYQRKRRRDPVIKNARRDYDQERHKLRQADAEYKAWRREYSREYNRERYRNDPKINLDRRIKGAIRKSLRNRGCRKTSPKAQILGWTIDELIAHFGSLFEEGMSWANMDMWHIDHIMPLSAVQYASGDDAAFKWAWALDNLAPLWANDNQEKLARTDWVLPENYKNPKLRALYENRNQFLTVFG
jgi:hypothetical protein